MAIDIGITEAFIPGTPPGAPQAGAARFYETVPWRESLGHLVQAILEGEQGHLQRDLFSSQLPRHLASSLPAETARETETLLAQTAGPRPAISPETVKAVERELIDYCVDLENEHFVTHGSPVTGWLGPGDLVAGALASRGIGARDPVRITLARPPVHGRVTTNGNKHLFHLRAGKEELGNVELTSFLYTPGKDYLGTDFAAFEVEVNGHTFRMSYELRVVKEYLPEGGEDQCPSGVDRFPEETRRTVIVMAKPDAHSPEAESR